MLVIVEREPLAAVPGSQLPRRIFNLGARGERIRTLKVANATLVTVTDSAYRASPLSYACTS